MPSRCGGRPARTRSPVRRVSAWSRSAPRFADSTRASWSHAPSKAGSSESRLSRDTLGPMSSDVAAPGLPEAMSRALADYERHLASERDLSPNTVRAYLGDVAGLLDHATRLGHQDVGTLDLRTLRSWLAKQQTLGRSRTTMARRGTAARVFTAWLA